MHITAGYPLFCLEANQRKSYYLPPANNAYPNGWLWIDGNQHAGTTWWTWESLITNRMDQTAPVDIRLEGWYSTANRTGTIFARVRNDSIAGITGRLIMVVTEDSLYYPAPNYDSIHNHVARDYLPDQNGSTWSIPVNDSILDSRPFILAADWNTERCKIIAWLQNDSIRADSTKEIWQAAMIPINSLSIEEAGREPMAQALVIFSPNPCQSSVRISLTKANKTGYSARFYDAAGRVIRRIATNGSILTWDLKDQQGVKVNPGIVFCMLEGSSFKVCRTIVVQ